LFCPECGTRNPEENRFCGMCGERLPDRTERAASKKPGAAAIVPPTTRVVDTPEPAHTDKWVEAPASQANPATSSAGTPRDLVDSLAERRPRNRYESDVREERRGRRDVSEPVGSSAPSFLGLGSADYEPPQREISWRFWALMLVLLGVVALFGLQWRANRLRAEQGKPTPDSVSQPAGQSSPSDDLNSSSNAAGDNKTDAQPKQDSSAPASTADQQQNKTTNDKVTKDKTATPAATDNPDQSNDQNQKNSAEPKSPKGAKSSSAKSGAATASDASEDNAASDNSDGDIQDAQPSSPKSSDSSESGSSASRAKVQKTRAETPREFSDAPVNQADSLIAGGDCNGAVRVLRAAGDNPRALTKLGAMYLTGTCVQSDRVLAYAWFSQAFNSDPHNLRLESTRRMIWQQMTDEERGRVEQGVGIR
jgi:hypothetical protein